MSVIQGLLSVLGRLCLVTIFLMSALMQKIPKFHDTVAFMHQHNVPIPHVLLPFAIVFLLVGGVSVLVGYHARIGATLLAVFLVLATYYFHNFWALPADRAPEQMIHAMKNLGLFGAMIFIVANGSGAWSLDAALASSRAAPEISSRE